MAAVAEGLAVGQSSYSVSLHEAWDRYALICERNRAALAPLRHVLDESADEIDPRTYRLLAEMLRHHLAALRPSS